MHRSMGYILIYSTLDMVLYDVPTYLIWSAWFGSPYIVYISILFEEILNNIEMNVL